MGAHPYYYFVNYKPDVDALSDELREPAFYINTALQDLRRREFEAGRYNPVIPFLEFPINADSPAPGAQHTSIEEALEDSDADGTRSILDLDHLADEPEFCAVTLLDEERLMDLYGTTTPTRAMVEVNMDFFEDVERGQGVYIVLFKNGEPDEIFFGGYSFD
jgi:hypothetical protein